MNLDKRHCSIFVKLLALASGADPDTINSNIKILKKIAGGT